MPAPVVSMPARRYQVRALAAAFRVDRRGRLVASRSARRYSEAGRSSVAGGHAMADAVIVEAVRSPVGKKNGKLAVVRPDDLAAHVIRALVDRAGVDPGAVEDVIFGCVDQLGEQGFNIARNAALIAGMPLDVCGVTLDRMCGSGQQAADYGFGMVASGKS